MDVEEQTQALAALREQVERERNCRIHLHERHEELFALCEELLEMIPMRDWRRLSKRLYKRLDHNGSSRE